MRAWLRWLAPAPLLSALAVLPVILGVASFYLRDVSLTHLPLRWAVAEAVRDGRPPLLDPGHAGGQALAGNPNAVALYPSSLLFLRTGDRATDAGGRRPFLWAFNAHLWLHWLAMPMAMAFLARACGQSRLASSFAGACYGLAGYGQSQLLFYNLIGAVTLAPVVTGCVLLALGADASARGDRRRRRAAAAAGLVWGLILLAGDPLLALETALLVIAAWWLVSRSEVARVDVTGSAPRRSWRSRHGTASWPILLALAAGSLLAAPQLVELARVVPLSYRGHQGFSELTATATSFDPRQTIEWLLPFAFGRPAILGAGQFWGSRFYTDWLPYYPTLYPGLLALVLIAAAGWSRCWPVRFAWLAIGGGVFVALGRFNPLVTPLLEQASSSLRYPIKWWLPVAIGSSLLCGVGVERWLLEGDPRSRRRALAALTVLACLFAILWLALAAPPAAGEWLAHLMRAGSGSEPAAEQLALEHGRWLRLARSSLVMVAGIALCGWRAAQGGHAAAASGPRSAGRWLLALLLLHIAGQLAFLAPARVTDDIAGASAESPLLSALPPGARVVQADRSHLFGPAEVSDGEFPEPSVRWVARRAALELYPPYGRMWGLRYELEPSAEGLDSFLSKVSATLLPMLTDDERLALLRAWGVDYLVIGRPLAAAGVELLRRLPSYGHEVLLYRLSGAAAPVAAATVIRWAPSVNDAARLLRAPDFDPRREVVLAGDGPAASGAVSMLGAPGGETAPPVLTVQRDEVEELAVAVDMPTAGALVVQRSHLASWKASVDGEATDVIVANLYRMAVALPPGRHEVRLWYDRRPFYVSLVVALCGALALLGLAVARPTGQP